MAGNVAQRSRVSIFATVALCLFAAAPAFGELGPRNVAVVVNADSWASLTVANEYVALRGIPSRNVIALRDVPGFEHVGVDEFRSKLLGPVLKTIDERGLAWTIDCIAWSSDFPYAVDVQSDVAAAGLKLGRVFTPVASINGLTFLHEQVMAKDPRYLELNANWYYRKPVRQDGKGEPPRRRMEITADELAKYREAMKLVQEKKWVEATPILAALAKDHPGEMQLQYNLACCLAREAKHDEALKALELAVEAGWSDRDHAVKDEDLNEIRERPEFKALAEKMVPPLFDVPTHRDFRSRDRWNEPGERVAGGGRRYLLSTMLAVTSGRGNAVADIVGNFALGAAERDPNEADRGTVFFLRNGDIRSKTREWAFASAVAKLTKSGVKAEIVDGVLPQKRRVLGAMVGIADFDWNGSGSTIAPGAIVEHLTSFGGVMREHSGQTPLSAFLRHGAAGASGTVTEPYAIQAKFPTPFLQVHYAAGCSLAEAFYQSVQGPYQLLIVGDPLCRLGSWKATKEETSPPSRTPSPLTLSLLDAGSTDPAKGDVEIGLDRVVRMRLDCPGARTITVLCQGSPVAEIVGNGGLVGIPARALGSGPVRFEAVAETEAGRVESEAVRVRIAAPSPLPARTEVDGAKSVEGLRLLVDGAEPAIVSDLRAANWLVERKLAPGTRFWIEAVFQSTAATRGGPYASTSLFQWHDNCDAQVSVDDSPLRPIATTGWRFAPCGLEPGWHRLTVTGRIPSDPATAPRLSIRYGNDGTQSLDGRRFRHVVTP